MVTNKFALQRYNFFQTYANKKVKSASDLLNHLSGDRVSPIAAEDDPSPPRLSSCHLRRR